jgi:dTDP-glucose 4,6-dehydratase
MLDGPVLSRSGIDGDELDQLVRGNEALFRALAGASILITGATGWFGVWLLDLLFTADDVLELGIHITAVSRQPERFLARFAGFAGDSRIRWIKADVRQLETSRERDAFSHIIHGAADTSSQPGPDAAMRLFDTIVEGTRRALLAAGPRCRSVLLLSSGAIYGPPRADAARFVESQPGGPDPAAANNAYAQGKRAAEQLGAIAASAGAPVRIARCFAFVGPHMPFDGHFAIGNFIADAVRGRPILIKSDGRPQRSYLYMSDLMRALLSILSHGAVGRPYNVGSGEAISIEDLAHRVDRAVGGCGVRMEGAASDPQDRYVPDTTRLRTELGFEPRITLDAAIIRTAEWYRARLNRSVSS